MTRPPETFGRLSSREHQALARILSRLLD